MVRVSSCNTIYKSPHYGDENRPTMGDCPYLTHSQDAVDELHANGLETEAEKKIAKKWYFCWIVVLVYFKSPFAEKNKQKHGASDSKEKGEGCPHMAKLNQEKKEKVSVRGNDEL